MIHKTNNWRPVQNLKTIQYASSTHHFFSLVEKCNQQAWVEKLNISGENQIPFYADPNSANHFSWRSMSARETLGWTFLRLIPFMEASRHTSVKSSPLYPSVRRATSSMFTSGATCMVQHYTLIACLLKHSISSILFMVNYICLNSTQDNINHFIIHTKNHILTCLYSPQIDTDQLFSTLKIWKRNVYTLFQPSPALH